MSNPSYSSDTPSRRHPWHNDSFYNILDIEEDLKINRDKRAAERQQRIEEEKVRLRIANVQRLHSKHVSIPGIAEAMGLPIEQVEEDLKYIEHSMNQEIQAHTANINRQEEGQDIDDYERARRKFLITGFYEPKDSGGYVAIFH